MEDKVRHWRRGAFGSNADGKSQENNVLRKDSKDLPRKTKKKKNRWKMVKNGKKEELSNICLLGRSLDVAPRDTTVIKNNKFEIDTPRNQPRVSLCDDVSTVATGSQKHTLEQKIWIDMSNVAKFLDDCSILTTDVLPKDLLEAIRRREPLATSVTTPATVTPCVDTKNQRINVQEEKREKLESEKLQISSPVESREPSSNAEDNFELRRNLKKEEPDFGLENMKSDEDATDNRRRNKENTFVPAFAYKDEQLEEKKVACVQGTEKNKAGASAKKITNEPQSKGSVKKKKTIKRQTVEPATSTPLPKPPPPPTLESFTDYYVPSNDPATISPVKRQWMLSPRQLIFGSPPKKSRFHQNSVVPENSPMKRMSSYLLRKVTLRDESFSLASPQANKPKHIIDTGQSDARFYPDLSSNTEDDGLLLLSGNEHP